MCARLQAHHLSCGRFAVGARLPSPLSCGVWSVPCSPYSSFWNFHVFTLRLPRRVHESRPRPGRRQRFLAFRLSITFSIAPVSNEFGPGSVRFAAFFLDEGRLHSNEKYTRRRGFFEQAGEDLGILAATQSRAEGLVSVNSCSSLFLPETMVLVCDFLRLVPILACAYRTEQQHGAVCHRWCDGYLVATAVCRAILTP